MSTLTEQIELITKRLTEETSRPIVYLGKGGSFKRPGLPRIQHFAGWYGYEEQIMIGNLSFPFTIALLGKNPEAHYFVLADSETAKLNITHEIKKRIKL